MNLKRNQMIEWKQPSVKPPRHFSVDHHSISSDETLLVSADLDFGVDIKEIEGKPSFLPVFRCGSCAEMGPKQYMEDEHIQIDNVAEYLGDSASFGSPGSFLWGFLMGMVERMQHLLLGIIFSSL